MHGNYMDNFFKKVNKSYVARYTDSTDFEIPSRIPAVNTKYGKHSLLDADVRNDCPPNIRTLYQDPKLTSSMERERRFQNVLQMRSKGKATDYKDQQHSRKDRVDYTNNHQNNRGDNHPNLPNSILRDKLIPRLSHIFKRPSCNKQLPSIEENIDVKQNKSVDDERRSLKKRKTYRSFEQPVYNVEGDIRTAFLIKTLRQNRTKNQSSSTPSTLTSSVGSVEKLSKRRSKMTSQEVGVENYEMFYTQTNLDSSEHKQHKSLQYPSKYLKSTIQGLKSTCCQASYRTMPAEMSAERRIQPSSSSSFWNFVADKIQSKYKKKGKVPNECACDETSRVPSNISNQNQGLLTRCSPSSCERFKKPSRFPDCVESPYFPPSPTKAITPELDPQSLGLKLSKDRAAIPLSKKLSNHECQCSSNETKPQKPLPNLSCQTPHDEITSSLADNYNGEILCIHNPPCVLINGCLTLPPPKPSGLLNIWRLTQNKKSSEMRRSKYTDQFLEQSCQYEPPLTIQDLLPEFQSEKIIQSACNHSPPCEVIRSCCKPKYDPALKDSCVHVPMCPKLPECRLRLDDHSHCSHLPKCKEYLLCSKNVTPREHMSTQVRPISRLLCQHDPPCFMIPKCIARLLCSESTLYEAIPECVHQPSCEIIPACHRKAMKGMVSVSSQYTKIPCRII